MKKPLIKYFKDGEWHYATVKDIGDLDMLNTFEKETIVDAINSIVINGNLTNENMVKAVKSLEDNIKIVDGNLDAHISNRSNPHGVTTEQVGTYSKTVIDNKDGSILTQAKTYIDNIKASLTELINNLKDNTYTKTEVDTKDSSILSQAKKYVDSVKEVIEQLIANAKTEIGNNTYTREEIDTKDTTALNTSKSYADSKVTSAKKELNDTIYKEKENIIAGNVYSSTKLQTPRRINGVEFDGTKDINLSANSLNAYTKAETDTKINNTTKTVKDNLDSHTSNVSNPHNVTASQVGTYTKLEIDSKDSSVLNSAKNYTYSQADINTKDSSTLSSAKSYADTKANTVQNNLNSHAGNRNNPHGVTAGQVGAYTKAEADTKVSGAVSGVQGNINSHIANKSNPHGVTASQVGTYTKTEIDGKISGVTNSVKNFNFGGRNILRGTADMVIGSENWAKGHWRLSGSGTIKTVDVADSPVKGVTKGILATPNAGTKVGPCQDGYSLQIPGIYTLSVWVKGQKGARVIIQTYWNQGIASPKMKENNYTLKSNDWERVSITGEVEKYTNISLAYLFAFDKPATFIAPYMDNSDVVNDWYPAPEDQQSQIDGINNNLSNNYYQKTAVDSKDTTTLNSAKSYADGKATSVQNNLNGHTNNRSNPHGVTASQVGTYTKQEIDTKDSSTLSSAKSYADGKAGSVQTNLNTHTGSRSNPHGVTASQVGAYTKSETDTRDSSVLSSAKGYADGKANTVQNNLNSHTGNRSNPHGVTASQVGAYSKGETYSRAEVDKKVIAGVGNINIGGENLIRNTRNYSTGMISGQIGGTGTTTTTEIINDIKVPSGKAFRIKKTHTSSSTTQGGRYFSTGSTKLVIGRTYTWTVLVRGSGTVTQFGHEQGATKSVTLTSDWKRVDHTFTVTRDNVYQFVFYSTQPFDLYFTDIMVVEGNVGVGWHPNSEDMATDRELNDLRNHVIFVGTEAQWKALGTTEQNKYILKAIVE